MTTSLHDHVAKTTAAPPSSSSPLPPLPSLLAAQEALYLLHFALDTYSRHQDGVVMLMRGKGDGLLRVNEEEVKLMCHHLSVIHKMLRSYKSPMIVADERQLSSFSGEEGVSVVARNVVMVVVVTVVVLLLSLLLMVMI